MMQSASPAKRHRSTAVTIGTHNGTFHCDEVLACYMLKLLPEYKDATIIRTRDPALLKDCDIVVDVGGQYDPAAHKYDHHQRTFDGTMQSLTDGKKPWTTKLSSAGLVYLHFGHRIIATIADTNEDDSTTGELYNCVYTNFVEEVDAVDNGINDRDGTPRYKVSTTISKRIGRLNPAWNDDDQGADSRFQTAMKVVGKEFTECVLDYKNAWMPARNIAKKALDTRHQVDSTGEIIHLEPYCPWVEHLFELESKLSISPNIKFVLYREKDSDKYRVQAVPVHPTVFKNRVSLPEAWCGTRDSQLSELSGIPGCVFVHANGFIGGNQTYTGALKMATRALELKQ